MTAWYAVCDYAGDMAKTLRARDAVKPLLRVRQTRQFTSDQVTADELGAIADAARWSGSSQNKQPWRFITIRDAGTLRAIAEAGQPNTRAMTTATAAIAIVLPEQAQSKIGQAYDEGRAAERILVAAELLDLSAGIAWVNADTRAAVNDILRLPADRFVRTIVAIGHASSEGRRPKTPRGEARLPRSETVYSERWPEDGSEG
jgi:nitroreductase